MSLTNTVQTLTSNFQSLMKDVLTLKESTGSRISQLEAKVEDLKSENQRLDSELQRSKAKERNLSSLVASFQASLSNVSSLVNKSKKVGFSASVSSSESSWNSGALVFPSVITNEGNGYNPSTGIFTAPIAGMYVFFVNVQSYRSQTIFVDIVLNGSTKVRTMAWSNGNDYFDAGPNMVVLTIQKGDAVWITRHSGAGYYNDGPITTFSGFLIHM
ncbi:complement C1q tumor necrosis factor-related protein 3-like [Saccostrea cucullata]|uniref:complement C1q tumor necrosis factor-related protein 3-like n=1 Tax=Saccostrea cuccullata TaxID=36930 RepID=UPI002ED69C9E